MYIHAVKTCRQYRSKYNVANFRMSYVRDAFHKLTYLNTQKYRGGIRRSDCFKEFVQVKGLE